MTQFDVEVDGLATFNLDGLSKRKIRTAAYRAINRGARDGRARAARMIREQVNLPASYVSPSERRLSVTQQANAGSLQAKITARARNTSLSRFVQGSPRPNRAGLYVEVAPGKVRFMKRAFLIRLPQGSALTDTKFNLGLAIRLRKGERLENKRFARRIASGLYVLYGPSVDQIFRASDGRGVASDITPEIEEIIQREFFRQLNL